MNRLRVTVLAIATAAMMAPLTSRAQPPEQAQLQVPVGQIEAFCSDFRQAFESCVTQKGVSATSRPLTDKQIAARRECRLQIQEKFDLFTASFCPGPEVSMATANYVAMCVELNEKTKPCLEKLGYAAVVGQPLTPEEHAWLHHCREQAGADMTVASRCGPPAYAHAP